jgi:hypothetical protein
MEKHTTENCLTLAEMTACWDKYTTELCVSEKKGTHGDCMYVAESEPDADGRTHEKRCAIGALYEDIIWCNEGEAADELERLPIELPLAEGLQIVHDRLGEVPGAHAVVRALTGWPGLKFWKKANRTDDPRPWLRSYAAWWIDSNRAVEV